MDKGMAKQKEHAKETQWAVKNMNKCKHTQINICVSCIYVCVAY